jgi:hypothetical protein
MLTENIPRRRLAESLVLSVSSSVSLTLGSAVVGSSAETGTAAVQVIHTR